MVLVHAVWLRPAHPRPIIALNVACLSGHKSYQRGILILLYQFIQFRLFANGLSIVRLPPTHYMLPFRREEDIVDSFFGFDLLVGLLALQGLIADILIVFGVGFVAWLWLADRKLNRQQKANEDKELMQVIFDQIDVIFQDKSD